MKCRPLLVESKTFYLHPQRRLTYEKKIIRWPTVEQQTGLSRSTAWRLEKAGKFPQRVRVGLRGVGWYESEIDAYNGKRERILLRGRCRR
mmetsp:Transcript_20891/g.9599  ORF Transcript_20891/g.9599 Transcript_20891/m.9599 type:complete len:90 (+) Transcript_20891:157-426(+)